MADNQTAPGANTPAPLTADQQKRQLAKNRINTLKANLSAPSVMEQFKNVLAENSGPFIASIIDLYNGDNKLQECDPNAVIFEALKAASLKLPVNKAIGFAYIYAFNGTPTMIIGYKGYIQLAMRTGQYKIINTDVVYEGELRSKDKLSGTYDLNGEAISDKIIGYFAHFEILNGFTKTLYMTVDQVHAWAKKYSPGYRSNNKIWKDEFDKMALKTVLRNLLSHWGYMSVEMVTALQSDADYDNTDLPNNAGEANSKTMQFEDANSVDVTGQPDPDKTDPPAGNAPVSNPNDPKSGIEPNSLFDAPKVDVNPGFSA